MSPLISVVIANYNYGRYLAETIESVLAQTYPHVEVIFIDDGSTDDSLEIAQRYPITVLAQQNQGVSTARNNAAQYARGEYILFLDSDDLLYPDSLEVLQTRLEAEEPAAGFAYGQLQYFGEKNTIFSSQAFDSKALSRENYIQTSALIRLAAFNAVGGFDRGFDLREDWGAFYPPLALRLEGGISPATRHPIPKASPESPSSRSREVPQAPVRGKAHHPLSKVFLAKACQASLALSHLSNTIQSGQFDRPTWPVRFGHEDSSQN